MNSANIESLIVVDNLKNAALGLLIYIIRNSLATPITELAATREIIIEIASENEKS